MNYPYVMFKEGFLSKFHHSLEQWGITYPLNTQSISSSEWNSLFLICFSYITSYLINFRVLTHGHLKTFFLPFSYFSQLLFYIPLLLFSMSLHNMEISPNFYQPLTLTPEIFDYLIVSLMMWEMCMSALRPFFGQRLRAINLYRLYTAIPWAYMALVQPRFFHHMVMLELIYQTVYNSYHFITKCFPFLSFLKYFSPFVFALRLMEYSFLIYFNIAYFYDSDFQSNLAFYWVNQILTLCNIVAILNCFECILSTYSTQFRNSITIFLLSFHVFALIGCILIYLHPNRLRLLAEVISVYMISGLGITCGAHRLWAHRSYKAHWSYRTVMMLLNSVANQGSIYHWCRDHRVHHKYSEQEKDPHNASRGFFYSHMGWLLLKKPKAVKLAGQDIDCSDLLGDPLVVFQKKCDPFWNQSMCFLLPSVYAHYAYGSFWLGFFTLGALRWILCLHATWTVNSIAHIWGERPYNPSINPAESFITSMLAVGEGWHNWHHEYPYDYAASEGGFYTHWNPSKIIIDIAARFNLVYDRKRAVSVWKKVQARRFEEEKKKAEHVVEVLKHNPSISKLPDLKGYLPAHVAQKSFILSSLSVTRDLFACCCLIGMAWYFAHYPLKPFPAQLDILNWILSIACWTLYALVQGTVAFGLWVLGYEAAGGRYCNSRILNHIVGAVLHSLLLTPYRPRRRHREKEREKASLLITLTDSQFGIFKITMDELYSFGGIILVCFIAFFAYYIKIASFKLFFHIYIGPWIVLNAWLMLYEWILENGPQNTWEVGLSESHWQLFTGDFLLRSWPKYKEERRYYTARFIDYLHHNLSLSHFVQAVDFNVPHYHAKEAFKRLGDLLGDVSNEVQGAKNQLVSTIKKPQTSF